MPVTTTSTTHHHHHHHHQGVLTKIEDGILEQCFSGDDYELEAAEEKLSTYMNKVKRNRSENSHKHNKAIIIEHNKQHPNKYNKNINKLDRRHGLLHSSNNQRTSTKKPTNQFSCLPPLTTNDFIPPPTTVSIMPLFSAASPWTTAATKLMFGGGGDDDAESTTNESTTNDDDNNNNNNNNGNCDNNNNNNNKQQTKLDLIPICIGLNRASIAAIMASSSKYCCNACNLADHDPTICTYGADHDDDPNNNSTEETNSVTTTTTITIGATATTATEALTATSPKHNIINSVVIENLPKDIGREKSAEPRKTSTFARIVRSFSLLNCAKSRKIQQAPPTEGPNRAEVTKWHSTSKFKYPKHSCTQLE